jgi:hypothetical protein
VADEKKPKIDLKARLNRGAANNPPSSGGGVLPPPSTAGGLPPPISSPPGLLVGPPPPFAAPASTPELDPSNPLSAVANVYRPSVAAPAVARPQRIEMDESTVVEARKGGMRQGIIIGGVAALVTLGIGWVAGGASVRGEARDSSRESARGLSKDVADTKVAMKAISDKLEAGRASLLKDHKFPDTLARDLGGINVDFGGDKLAGRRFSGVKPETVKDLTTFITDVTALNEHKTAIIGLLNALQKPLTEQLNAPPNQATLSQIVVITRDQSGPQALLAPLSVPITLNAENVSLPDSFAFADPLGNGNSKLDRYKSGDISAKPAAIPVVSRTFDKLCPSESSGKAAKLAVQLGTALEEINGDAKPSGDQQMVQETKSGLLERADLLSEALKKAAD